MSLFKAAKNTSFNPQEINILNAGTRIQGDLNSEGDLRVDGAVQGNIVVKTKLVLGQSSSVKGNIIAQNCDISGIVNGNIKVSELLVIKASAQINGDISCSKLIIESGAAFNGNSAMKSMEASSEILNGAKAPKPLETKAPVIAEPA
jgi:cytoskeletal protein CcmA (bactofilin family)